MVYPDEVVLPKFRQLFLKALEPLGVTEITTVTLSVTAGMCEIIGGPYHRMEFILHTNVGTRSYSIPMSQVVSYNDMNIEESAWDYTLVTLDYKTNVLKVFFSNMENTVLELFPKVQLQGNKEDV